MSNFFEQLWESIFTPGPTPTLLIATNATFAVLQVLLAALLVATYSVHFLVLSIISGGLWWAINWFAAELKESQRLELAEKEAAAKAAASQAQARGSSSSSDDETEVETGVTPLVAPGAKTSSAATGSNEVQPAETTGELKHRSAAAGSGALSSQPSSSAGTRSGAETEDEWEKVSENEKEKDR